MKTGKKTRENGMKAGVEFSTKPRGTSSLGGRASEEIPKKNESEVRTVMGGFLRKDCNGNHAGQYGLRTCKRLAPAGAALMAILTMVLAFGWAHSAEAATYYVKAQSSQNVGTNGSTNMTSLTDRSVSKGSSNQNRAYMTTGAPSGTTRYRVSESDKDSRSNQEFFRAYTPKYSAATTIGANATAYADFYMRNTNDKSVTAKATLYEYNDTTGIVGSAKGTASYAGNARSSSRQAMNNVSFGNTAWTVAAGNRLMVVFSFAMDDNQPAYLWGQASSSTPSGNQSITVAETVVPTCTAAAATVAITPASQTITTNGGSAAYSVTIKNNDSGAGCSNVTFTLAPSDSNTTSFNASTLGSTSVTLAPGATSSAITLTVSGKSGQTSGADTTTATASATGHTNGSSSVTTTLNVTAPVCTANTPTVTITTLPKTITTSGGSVGYSFTVTNNDTGSGCSPVTYNLSAADSNTANFNPSTVSVASVSLSAGATSLPMVVSVSGVAGKLTGTNTTTVTASATGHTNGSSSVTTTLNVVCTLSAPTLTITPGFQNIAVDGGSVSYTLNVQNNDTAVACSSSTTFNLTPMDSNPGSYVLPSTLSQSSVTLAPGANANVTLTVTAKSGVTSGTNSTSVSSAPSAHDTGATSNSVATSIVIAGPCTANTPSLQISPSQTVTPGGTASYTISVTNNDTGACSMTAFTLNVVSDTNPTNFTTPSTINPSTLSLAPGASGTAFLVVSSMSTAPTSSFNTTTVGLAAAGHAAPPNVSVTTTVVVPPPVPNTALLHNSTNTKSTKWSAQGGWGIPGGVYGQFICETCHAENTANIKRVKTPIIVPDTSKGNIPGSTVNFQSTTSPNGFGDDSDNHTSSTKVCEVCHTITAHHRYNTTSQTDGKNHFNNQDCISCHKHAKGFTGGDCIGCHSVQQGNRVAVASLFSGTSHHIQGVTLTNQMCYQCHWEANIDGSVNAIYHGGSANPGAPVRLVIYGAGTRPTTYTVGTTAVEYMSGGSAATLRTELLKINQHCLGCHSAQNSVTQPFGDGKTPNTYAWDSTKTSIAERYSQTGTTPWGKYSGAKTNMKSTLTKAFSAHGNAAANMRGWDNRPASAGGTGVDGTITNASGGVQVLCFDCHNSHGSTVSGTTTSYASATTNGGIFKDTTANLGGYKMTYKPQAEGSDAGKNVSNPGGSLCIDCHMTQTSGTTPWGWQDTFGSTQAIMGYWEKPYWTGAAGTNPAGPQLRYPYKNLIGSKGGHFGGSSSLNTAPMGTINGLCTPCHDPHGVSPTLGANEAYGVPLLKGTWMTSPYREDVAPLSVTDIHAETGEDADRPAYTQASAPFYNIDQNTFDAGFTTTVGHLTVPTWNFNSTKRVTETADKFGGLCLNCHPKTSIAPGNNSAWKSMDRIHNSVAGWGTYGANAANAIHSYTCSKCHTPHNSCLPRLLITNCLDFTHRGQVGNGGVAGGAGVRGDEGAGVGAFPGGGGGTGEKRSYAYFFGNSGSRYSGSGSNLQTCHDNANTSETWPNNERWNVKSPWGTQGSPQPPLPTLPGGYWH